MMRQGKVLFTHIETSAERAQIAADDYRNDRRNCGQWRVRIYARTVRANSVTVPAWVVVVREKGARAES